MKEKINLFIITLILILPITFYTLFKMPSKSNIAQALDANKPTVTVFSSTMCMECKKLKKVMDKVQPEYDNKITFHKVDANTLNSEVEEKIKKYNVTVVPTTVFEDEKNNKIFKKEGAMTQRELEKNLNELLK